MSFFSLSSQHSNVRFDAKADAEAKLAWKTTGNSRDYLIGSRPCSRNDNGKRRFKLFQK